MNRTVAIDFLYGTAWKEDRTATLTELAIREGFRGIDTANQRRHYFEEGVGHGLAAAYRSGLVTRSDLFLQTKFTDHRGQDYRLPYDPDASFSTQVVQSMASSLEHLGTDHVDSYVLHGPSSHNGWTDAGADIWEAMATYFRRSCKTVVMPASAGTGKCGSSAVNTKLFIRDFLFSPRIRKCSTTLLLRVWLEV